MFLESVDCVFRHFFLFYSYLKLLVLRFFFSNKMAKQDDETMRSEIDVDSQNNMVFKVLWLLFCLFVYFYSVSSMKFSTEAPKFLVCELILFCRLDEHGAITTTSSSIFSILSLLFVKLAGCLGLDNILLCVFKSHHQIWII